ncbi:MAG: O-antigen ligase family protein [Thermodesulfobacteriota bacterium]
MDTTPSRRPALSRLTVLQEVSLYAVLFTIPLFRLGTEITGSESLTPAKIFIGLTFVIWITRILIEKDDTALIFLFHDKATLLMLAFLVITFMSLMFTRYIEPDTIQELSLRIKTALLYFLIVGIIIRRQALKAAIIALLLGSLLTTGAGLYEAATGDAFFKESYRHQFRFTKQSAKTSGLQKTYGGGERVQGLYSDAGFYAHALIIFIGLAMPWALYGRTRSLRAIMAILLLAYLINLIGTGARTGWAALGCAMGVFLLLMKHPHKYLLWAVSVLSVIAVFLGSSLMPNLPTVERLQLKGSISWSWRLDTNLQALEMVRDHPVLGVGTGNYMVEYFNYLEGYPRLSRAMMGWLHNSYLQVWVENGTVGLIILLAFMATVMLGLLDAYFKPSHPDIKIMALGLTTAFVGYAVEFSGVPVIGQEMGWLVFGFSVALISINRRDHKELTAARG